MTGTANRRSDFQSSIIVRLQANQFASFLKVVPAIWDESLEFREVDARSTSEREMCISTEVQPFDINLRMNTEGLPATLQIPDDDLKLLNLNKH